MSELAKQWFVVFDNLCEVDGCYTSVKAGSSSYVFAIYLAYPSTALDDLHKADGFQASVKVGNSASKRYMDGQTKSLPSKSVGKV